MGPTDRPVHEVIVTNRAEAMRVTDVLEMLGFDYSLETWRETDEPFAAQPVRKWHVTVTP